MTKIFFQNYKKPSCCLCGGIKKPTGEHKIKAASLKSEFGDLHLSVEQIGKSKGRKKFAQSTQSKHLKFDSRICEECNTSRTQGADHEFDRFTKLARVEIETDNNPASLLERIEYRVGSEPYLNLFRYFAKLLCCHLAEIDAPRPRRLSEFAIDRSNANYVCLAIQKDPTYNNAKKIVGNHQYAAHSGLIISGDNSSGGPSEFHSTLTIGPLHYVYFIKLAPIEQLELEALHPNFFQWCQTQVELAKENPLSASEKRAHGLIK